jgi:hypothetical protein
MSVSAPGSVSSDNRRLTESTAIPPEHVIQATPHPTPGRISNLDQHDDCTSDCLGNSKADDKSSTLELGEVVGGGLEDGSEDDETGAADIY